MVLAWNFRLPSVASAFPFRAFDFLSSGNVGLDIWLKLRSVSSVSGWCDGLYDWVFWVLVGLCEWTVWWAVWLGFLGFGLTMWVDSVMGYVIGFFGFWFDYVSWHCEKAVWLGFLRFGSAMWVGSVMGYVIGIPEFWFGNVSGHYEKAVWGGNVACFICKWSYKSEIRACLLRSKSCPGILRF